MTLKFDVSGERGYFEQEIQPNIHGDHIDSLQ